MHHDKVKELETELENIGDEMVNIMENNLQEQEDFQNKRIQALQDQLIELEGQTREFEKVFAAQTEKF